MKTATFKEWDLDKLDEAFGLSQVFDDNYPLLKSWQQTEVEISEFEKQILLDLQQPLIWGGKSWNGFELENKFISPVIMVAKIDDKQIAYFLERTLSAVVGDYKLSDKDYKSDDDEIFAIFKMLKALKQMIKKQLRLNYAMARSISR